MKNILIVEDDLVLCEELKKLLRGEGYMAEYLQQFQNIVEEIVERKPDLVLLDINLPGVSGEMILQKLRRQSQVPVIMVTSRTSESDEVLSMSYGADDYITKPYNPTILLLRIAAVLKRMEHSGNTAVYRDMQVNFSKGTISGEGRELLLTKNEMLIFQLLLQQRGKIVSRDALMTNLWDNNEFINDNALTVNISRLRNKLAEFGYPEAIQTRKKQGYILI